MPEEGTASVSDPVAATVGQADIRDRQRAVGTSWVGPCLLLSRAMADDVDGLAGYFPHWLH